MSKMTVVSKEVARKETNKKSYCVCGAYAKVVNGKCRYCRETCKGSGEFPTQQGVRAVCDYCGKNVKLDNEFGRMREHTV